MKKVIRMIFFTACLAIFVFSGYKIIMYLIDAKQNKDLTDELIEKGVSVIDTEDEHTFPLSVDFSALKEQNEDIVGWIYLKDSPINYPVVQSKDNDYYLHRLINGNYNAGGTIFMDYRNDSNITDGNTILYGHHMKNGTMFGSLQKYRKQDYYDEHKKLYYSTPENNYTIDIFAGLTVDGDSYIYNMLEFDQEEINRLIKKSDFKSDVTVNEDDRIITLSTCAYEYEDARYVVMGVLRQLV